MRRLFIYSVLLLSASASILTTVGAKEPTANDGEDRRAKRVAIRFLGESMTTFEGLKVTLFRSTGDYSEDMKRPTASEATDESGAAIFQLAPGRYYVEIDSPKELGYLDLPHDYREHPAHFSRSIEVGEEPKQAIDFRLAAACRLTLAAIDAETGEGIPGVVFVTENALGEIWGTSIVGDNLGAPRETDETQKTDERGEFSRLLGPRPGYTYFPLPLPSGYELLGPHEVEIATDVGVKEAKHVFKFKKKR